MTDEQKRVTCYFCDQQATERRPAEQPQVQYLECPACTMYAITDDVVFELEAHPLTKRQRANASGWIREFGGTPIIQLQQLDYFIHRLATPTVGNRAEKLMVFLGKRFPDLNMMEVVDTNDPALAAVCWGINSDEVRYLLAQYLGETLGYLHCHQFAGPSLRMTILPQGWVYLDGLRSPNANSHQGFIAMWFDDSTIEVRNRSLIPAVQAAGYREFIIDQHPTNEDIMDEVLAGVRRSRFVVADFTGNRHNVYYEVGFAQGLNIPVIRTCWRDQIGQITFDVNHYPFLPWVPERLDEFALRLQNHIEATIGRGPFGATSPGSLSRPHLT